MLSVNDFNCDTILKEVPDQIAQSSPSVVFQIARIKPITQSYVRYLAHVTKIKTRNQRKVRPIFGSTNNKSCQTKSFAKISSQN